MKAKPRIGLTGETRFLVESQHVIDFAGEGMPAVLSTPWLVKFLEQAARSALEPLLEAGESSVGVEIEIKHLAPTPLGQRVTCLARVIHQEGPLVDFQVEARDETEAIARGLHKRAVIRKDRFAQRVERKRAGIDALRVPA